MKTEEVIRQPRTPGQMVARSLQSLAPTAIELVDHKGRRVPLSSAGHVLHSGRRYSLRITPPVTLDADLEDVEVLTPPEFVRVDKEVRETDSMGNRVRAIPFRVRLDLGTRVSRPGSIRGDELVVHFRFRIESGKEMPRVTLPVVVRPGLSLALFAVLGSLLGVLAPVVFTEFFGHGSGEDDTFIEKLTTWATDPRLWFGLLGLGVLVLFVFGWIAYQLRGRSKELHMMFHERYFPPQPQPEKEQA
jgi:hypothetical protein